MGGKLKSNLIKSQNAGQNELNNNTDKKKKQEFEKNAGKVAFYIGSLHKGGAERVFVNLAEYFLNQDYQVLMVTQYQKEDEYELAEGIERIISDITPQETTDSRIVNFWRRMGKLHHIWKQEKPDLVLSCAGKNNFMTIVSTMFTKTKPVVSCGRRCFTDGAFSQLFLETSRESSRYFTQFLEPALHKIGFSGRARETDCFGRTFRCQ